MTPNQQTRRANAERWAHYHLGALAHVRNGEPTERAHEAAELADAMLAEFLKRTGEPGRTPLPFARDERPHRD